MNWSRERPHFALIRLIKYSNSLAWSVVLCGCYDLRCRAISFIWCTLFLSRVVLGGILGRNGYKNRLIIDELSAYKFIFLGQGFYSFCPRWSCLLVDWEESPPPLAKV